MTSDKTVESGRDNDLPEGLSAPAQRALAHAGIETLDDLARWREKDILALHCIGPKSMPTLRDALAATGLAFAGE